MVRRAHPTVFIHVVNLDLSVNILEDEVMSEDSGYLSAPDAASALGISLPTLYAYVSRGLLASEPVPGTPRARRYRRDEVERLRGRQQLRRHPEQAAPRAIAWGEPVLDSALTLIDGRCLWYRGRDAVELSRRATVEEVAALLWTGSEAAAGELFPAVAAARSPATRRTAAARGRAGSRRPAATAARGSQRWAGLSPIERLQAQLPLAGAADGAAWDLRPEAVARCGARILRLAAGAVAGGPLHPDGLASTLAAGWRPRGRGARAALSAALVLCADHELNVSTFAARCVASAEATPWDAVGAGLAALKGRRHGGEAWRVEALLREAAASSPAEAVASWLRRGERLPGVGHRLYPTGDPRGAELLALAERAASRSPALARVQALRAAAERLTGELPNVDLGLAALAAALRLPAGAPHALFALGRTIGWVAHAIEEYGRDALIRPRARYVGPAPGIIRAPSSPGPEPGPSPATR
jgi:citrate synthase